ncbi:Ppx/GppA phosphatase family-domain-containing protein [Apodospora peruviana]|uniref:Ppx/GppA phosphatase family-domain-containing protein n=1 Tax=Apodospora peruviana TaxID=516989 RepID=A0AAE0MEA4_9PEZI|nr:Ppx/GppA phosphatase family-domain-containing protein [Apodospora peruviana]
MGSTVDIITLANLAEKMPRWDPAASNHLFALVDMGSNGIRFSISDLSPPQTRLLKCVYRERAAISLFDALSKPLATEGSSPSLTFPANTIRLVSQTLARFRAIAVDDYGVPPGQVMVFATEAMRKAQNAGSMLDAIRSEAPDLLVHILAPQVETLFGAVGARSGYADVRGLFLDLGGGSIQMTYMDTYTARLLAQDENQPGYELAAALAGESLPFGAARLIRVLQTDDLEVQAAEMSRLNQGMGDAFSKLCRAFPSLAEIAILAGDANGSDGNAGIDVYLCGGGFRGYGSMLMHNDPIQPYPIPLIGSYTVSGEMFGRTKEMLEINKAFEGKIFGMSKRRRAQFPAIITVVEALIAAIPPIRSVTFCAGGNREGALMMKLPRDVRESSPATVLYVPTELVTTPTRAQEGAGLAVVVDCLLSAFPGNLDPRKMNTVFGMGLGHVYVSQIWDRVGHDDAANAAAALHDAIAMDPNCPGLTHLTRAVLGLTLCARWGGSVAPIDQHLYSSLRVRVNRSDPDTAFWADYIGALTAVLVNLITAPPKTKAVIDDNIRLRCTTEMDKKTHIRLEISVSEKVSRGIDLDELADLFKGIGKKTHKKITVTTSQLR